jgi:cellulose synthase/poly-beta-1,6-N-acetylglucosamine synthase-like glycosyltransferase
MDFNELSIYTILLFLAVFFLLIQLFYFVFFYFRIAFHKEKVITVEEYTPLSVVIAARSEAHNLVEFLPYIFEQDYPQFEVVVVNDRSWDDTGEILKAFQQKHSNLHVVNIVDGTHRSFGKKMALTLGIKGAKYETIVVTDADCKPVSKNWLKMINEAFHQKKGTELVLGFSPSRKEKGFLNKLIRFDAFWVALQYLSFAKAGIPYMGVGRNMAYTKDAFFKVGGFRKHYHIKSGDDDLFVNEIARKNNVNIMLRPDSQVETLPKTTRLEWVYQKKRHFTTAPIYKFKHRFLLALWPLSVVLFYLLCISLLVLNKFLLITLILLLVRTLILMVTFTRAGRWLGQKEISRGAVFYELIFLFIYPFIYLSGKIAKADKWS